MRLVKARVQNYRSIVDTGIFELESLKTILVGPNEAGKTVTLQALQQLNPPKDVPAINPLRDFPRAKYNDIQTGKIKPEDIEVVRGWFTLEEKDKLDIPENFHNCTYILFKMLDGERCHILVDCPDKLKYEDIKNDLLRLFSHLDNNSTDDSKPSDKLKNLVSVVSDKSIIPVKIINEINQLIDNNITLLDEDNVKENERLVKLRKLFETRLDYDKVLKILWDKIPTFILFSNYFKVKPSIHLKHLAQRQSSGMLDDEWYDYGNLCLLKLLGYTAQQLSDLADIPEPSQDDRDGLEKYKSVLDERHYSLNAGSVKLSNEIKKIWNPNPTRPEADTLRLVPDRQYLKVVVVDELGVEVELDQRSEGFQWLVSFFVVFFAESQGEYENSILLLDEPGLSLHALKQTEFRNTLSRLSELNQTIYTTHSPFLVGPNELDLVRVVEMKSRQEGTKIHTTLSSSDPAGLLPLQEALGYSLAQSLFSQQQNLVLEGITDYWYIESMSQLLKSTGEDGLNDKIALVFADSASKLVYYATILHAQKLKVAALLDSDSAGDSAASQDSLVHTLGNQKILRTKDFYPDISNCEIEDLLRTTLISIAKNDLGWDIESFALASPTKPVIDIFKSKIQDFSKYKLAKAFIKWSRDNEVSSLQNEEIERFKKLFEKVNKVLK